MKEYVARTADCDPKRPYCEFWFRLADGSKLSVFVGEQNFLQLVDKTAAAYVDHLHDKGRL